MMFSPFFHLLVDSEVKVYNDRLMGITSILLNMAEKSQTENGMNVPIILVEPAP